MTRENYYKKRLAIKLDIEEDDDDIDEQTELLVTFCDSNGVPLSDDKIKEILDLMIENAVKEKTSKKVRKRPLPDIKLLEKQVLECIVGQNAQVRQIITAIYRAKRFKDIKSNVLIIGKSGTGKTETIKQIAKRLKLPYTIEDATKYTQEGYVGASVEDMLYNLIESANYDIEKAEKGIIVVDEIDKKSSNEFILGPDVSGGEVLKSMLKMIEGAVFKVQDPKDPFAGPIDFNTENLIIIFSGAFAGLDKIQKRKEKNNLGFGRIDNDTMKAKQTKALKQDLIDYGLPEEFVGRIDTIITMNNLTKEDLVKILTNSKLSIFRKYEKALKQNKIELEYDPKIFELIAEEALTMSTGARELSNVVNYMFDNIIYEVLANPKKFRKCKIYLETVKDHTKFELS